MSFRLNWASLLKKKGTNSFGDLETKLNVKRDIKNKNDIELLVHTFYDRVKDDNLLSVVINEKMIPDWSGHLASMSEFWKTILLDKRPYEGKPAEKHLTLPITSHHFDRWITLFHVTLDDLYAGKQTEEAKYHAHKMAEVFRTKLHITGF
jgi:hemoglobin